MHLPIQLMPRADHAHAPLGVHICWFMVWPIILLLVYVVETDIVSECDGCFPRNSVCM